MSASHLGFRTEEPVCLEGGGGGGRGGRRGIGNEYENENKENEKQ